MDQDVGWWVRVGLDGWQRREGPRYRRIAAALADALARGSVAPGTRLPAERLLAEALGVSRGTAVRAYDELTQAGLVRRRQGAGTFVRPRPAWPGAVHGGPDGTYADGGLSGRTHAPAGPDAVHAVIGRAAHAAYAPTGHETDRHPLPTSPPDLIDLSLAAPASTAHLPPVEPLSLDALAGHGAELLDPFGLPALRAALARHLTDRLGLPTAPGRIVVTSGAGHALRLVAEALVAGGRTVVAGCPGGQGVADAVAAYGGRVVGVPVDELGVDVQAVDRAAAREHAPLVYAEPPAHDPTGAVLSSLRGQSLLDVVRRRDAVLVEDLSQAGLGHDDEVPAPVPLAARDDSVIALGSLSRTFWAGLRVGWLRVPAAPHAPVPRPGTHGPAPGVPAQLLAARLLDAADDAWHAARRRTLRERRDLLVALLARQLPAWQPHIPGAGLSLWVRLPVPETETFAHLAAAHYGVLARPGSALRAGRRPPAGLRLSLAASPRDLQAGVDRLTVAWEEHTRQLAAGLG